MFAIYFMQLTCSLPFVPILPAFKYEYINTFCDIFFWSQETKSSLTNPSNNNLSHRLFN